LYIGCEDILVECIMELVTYREFCVWADEWAHYERRRDLARLVRERFFIPQEQAFAKVVEEAARELGMEAKGKVQ
jgi:hypothetical protein